MNKLVVKNKKLLLIASIICLIIAFIMFSLQCYILYKKNSDYRLIDKDVFLEVMISKNYVISDLSNQYVELDNYYVAYNSTYGYQIEYVIGDEEVVNYLYSAVLNGDGYKIVYKFGNSLIYCVSSSNYSEYIEDDFRDLGCYSDDGYFVFLKCSLVLFGVVFISSWMTILKKANMKMWAIFVPIYREYCLYNMAFGKGWLWILYGIPFVNIIFGVIVNYNISKKFGKSYLFSIFFGVFNIFALPFLAYDNSQYNVNTY